MRHAGNTLKVCRIKKNGVYPICVKEKYVKESHACKNCMGNSSIIIIRDQSRWGRNRLKFPVIRSLFDYPHR